ncbi:MAG TPA: pilus assembly protein TadG-related protein [Ktedonobacterales bacterium]|nr:pilus assembly protein TadG-related protein [Ktedonobacterales bacterium]
MMRITRRSDQRAVRALPRRRRQSGQTLVIFALSVFVLIGLAGLSIDVMRVYDQYAHQLRAAEAGALAGIIYMPNFYSTPAAAIDNNSAITRALQQVQMNGFGKTAGANGSCTDLNTTGEVETCMSSKSGTALQVTVNEPISVFLLSVVGVQNFTITATAGADYLNLNVLGSNPGPGDRNTWGDGGKTNPKFFNPSINGPAEFKEMGDPYVYCEDGSSNGPPASQNFLLATTLLAHNVGGNITNAGFLTNHAAYPGGSSKCGKANPDQQPNGFTGEATRNDPNHPGAYNFAISGTAGDTVWIFNAPFSPNDPQSSCNGSQSLDAYMQDNSCSTYYTTYGPLTFDGSHFDDPRFAFNVTYSLYRAESLFTRKADVLVTGSPKTFAPMDQIKADLTIHGCATNGSQSYDLSDHSIYTFKVTGQGYVPGNGCETSGSYGAVPYTWTAIGTLPATDTYRLAVEATSYAPNGNNATCAAFTCGWGRHTYAIADCAGVAPPVNGLCPGSGLISGWNNFDLYLNFPSATKNNIYVPIADIPSTYAGRTVNLRLFNPGPTHGNGDDAYFMIVPPDPCIAINYPKGSTVITDPNYNWTRLAPYPGTPFPTLTGLCPQDTTSIYASAQNPPGNIPSDEIYKGLWIQISFDLPPNFAGGQFWLDNFSQKGKNFNQMAVSAQLAGGQGSPVHLIF